LSRPTLAATTDDINDAIQRATAAIEDAAWSVQSVCAAPPTGQRGSREAFIHASRRE